MLLVLLVLLLLLCVLPVGSVLLPWRFFPLIGLVRIDGIVGPDWHPHGADERGLHRLVLDAHAIGGGGWD